MGEKTSISVDESTLERFNAIREECKTDHTPAPTANGMLQSLMDEWETGGPNDPRDIDEDVILPSNGPDVDELLAELKQVRELVEQNPDRTAERTVRQLEENHR